jgi:LacI family transcriptional regulator
MRDVAALARVGLKTVSRVINGEPGVSPELRARVQRAIDQLDYLPNLTASSLRRSSGRSATIGLILENVANPFSSALHRAIGDVAWGRGVQVFSGSVDEDAIRERLLVSTFAGRRVDGFVVVPASHDHSYMLVHRHAVVSDNRGGSEEAVRHLLAVGHRRIAYLGDLATVYTARERYAGYVRGLDSAGISVDPAIVRHDLQDSDAAEAAAAGLLASPAPPTALFTSQNLVTIGAVRALRAAGAQHRVALVGFDDVLLADMLEPAVTVVAQDPRAIGTLAAQLLFLRMDGDVAPTALHVVPTRLIARGSGEIARPAA